MLSALEPPPKATPSTTHRLGVSKSAARGVFVVLKVDDPHLESEPAWTDPNIVGVLLRTRWSSVELTQSRFDWNYFDRGLSMAHTKGKTVILSVHAGNYSPSWIYGGAKAFALRSGEIPAPWDPVFQVEWGKLIAALGARYDADPSVVAITMGGLGKEIECFFARTASEIQELNAAGGVSIWATAARKIIDAYMAAFPATPCYLATGTNYEDQRKSMSDVVIYGLEKYPGRFGVQSNALSPHYPNKPKFPHTTIDCSSIPLIGYQLVAPVRSSRVGGTLAQTLANGIAHGAKWIQVYPGDPATDEAAVQEANRQMIK